MKILLSSTGCLTKKRWESEVHRPTLERLERELGSLKMSAEEEVSEAMVLLMQANEGFSNTIKKVQEWLRSEAERPGRQTDMGMLFDALTAINGCDRAATEKSLDWGRELFRKADLWP